MKSFTLIFAVLLSLSINALAQPEFTAYTEGNPVVPKGPAGSWDGGALWAPSISVINDTFYMTYQGTRNYQSWPMEIGLATSTDGYHFSKSPSNPIFSGDGSGFDAYAVVGGPLIYEGGLWYFYYSGVATAPNIPGKAISRATAESPHGPWTRSNDILLTTGDEGAWDDKITLPLQIFPTDTGLVMYYWVADDWYPNEFTCQIGLAISRDGGQTWQKFDDPATTELLYAVSDPLIKAGPEIFDDDGILGASIIKKTTQWEMVYCGIGSTTEAAMCYATSPDGINWEKYSGNPIFTFWDDPTLAVYGFLESPTVTVFDNTYFLYYDYGIGASGIGLATDPPIVGIEPLSENKLTDFKLFQNYPNPFNPVTTIEYRLSTTSQVNLIIYNILGKEVVRLVSENQPAGTYKVQWDASGLGSGIYFNQLQAGSFAQTKKLVLIK